MKAGAEPAQGGRKLKEVRLQDPGSLGAGGKRMLQPGLELGQQRLSEGKLREHWWQGAALGAVSGGLQRGAVWVRQSAEVRAGPEDGV